MQNDCNKERTIKDAICGCFGHHNFENDGQVNLSAERQDLPIKLN